MRNATLRFAPAQCGLSLVELLVGVAIGLFIAATGAMLMAGNLRESRSLLVETRLMQDLRSAADLISRDLRRAGYWGHAGDGVWSQGANAVVANPYADVTPTAGVSSETSFRYSQGATENDTVDSNEEFGFRLRSGVIDFHFGGSGWQALTDPEILTVTRFTVTPTVEVASLGGACAVACPALSSTCPPRETVRRLDVLITARSANDASVTRSVRSVVRLRNDLVSGACPV